VRCKEYKNKCPATGSISVDTNDNTFVMWKLHNHQSKKDETPMREFPEYAWRKMCSSYLTSYSAKVLYMQAIKK